MSGGIAHLADAHPELRPVGVDARVALVDDLGEYLTFRLEDLETPVRVIVADVGTEGEAIHWPAIFPEVAYIECAEHAAPDPCVAQQVVCGRVHHVAVIPGLVYLTADTLGVIDADAERLLGVRKVGVIQDAQQDDRGVLLAYVHWLRRVNPCGDQERKSGHATDLHAVVVVDLNECFVLTQGINFSHVSRFVDEFVEDFVGFEGVVVELQLLDVLADGGKNAGHLVLRAK